MSFESIRPRGTFQARQTRDDEALRRDGQVFLLYNDLSASCHALGGLVEILFQDGVWMLATPSDIDMCV